MIENFMRNEEERKKMGRAQAKASGNIKLVCTKCQKEHNVIGYNIGFLYWNSERYDSGETANIFYTRLPIECECGQDILMKIKIREFPPPALFDYPEYSVIGAELHGEFSIEIY